MKGLVAYINEAYDGGVKKLGNSGKVIKMSSTNHTAISKGVRAWLTKNKIEYGYNVAKRTNSIYIEINGYKGVNYKIRLANHSKAISLSDINEDEPIDLVVYDNFDMSVEIDASVGYVTKDIINIIGECSDKSKVKKLFGLCEKISLEDLYRYEHEFGSKFKDDTINDLLKSIGVKKDEYQVNHLMVISVIGSMTNKDDYKKYRLTIRDKEKQEAENKIHPNKKIVKDVSFARGVVGELRKGFLTIIINKANCGDSIIPFKKRIKSFIMDTSVKFFSGELSYDEFVDKSNEYIEHAK